MKHMTRLSLSLAGALLLAAPAMAQTKWNLPAAYPPDNFHTENLNAVRQGRGRRHRRQAADHGPRQRLAVQGAGDQARGADRPGPGRRGADVAARERGSGLRPRRGALPRHLLRSGEEALGRAEAGRREEAREPGPDAALRGAVAAAGHLRQEGHQHGRGPEGREVALLQSRARRASPNSSARSR